MDKLQNQEPLAVDIPVAGKMAGMTPQAAYRAAREGFMPTVRIGAQRKLVPLAKWRAILNGEATA